MRQTANSDPGTSSVEAIDSRRLQVFLEAARSTSFSAAAQVLGMVPSAVSHAIKALEEEFQCSLFTRRGPRVTLTKSGMRLLPLAEELLHRMTRLREEVVVLKSRSHHLRVMMPEIFCASKLPGLLPDFMECFPSAVFEVAPGDSDSCDALKTLDEGEIDLLISYRNHQLPWLVKRELFNEELGFFVAPFHKLSSYPPASVRDLGHELLLVVDEGTKEMLRSHAITSGDQGERIWKLPSVQTVAELAKSGQGVAVLPTWVVAESVAAGELTPLFHRQPIMHRTGSVYRSGRTDLGWSAEVFCSLIAMSEPKD